MSVAAGKQIQSLKISIVKGGLIIFENLSWNRGKVGKSEEVDQPNREDEADEGVLGYEVDTGEVGGEKKTDDWHHHSELNTVQHQARN